jgi:VanZ family protein
VRFKEQSPDSRANVMIFRGTLVAAVIGISYLAFTPTAYPGIAAVSDKLEHAAAFFSLALLLDYSFPLTRFDWRKALIVLGYGAGIEIVQYFLPWRESSVFDWLADLVGVLIYVASTPLLMRLPLLKPRPNMIGPESNRRKD